MSPDEARTRPWLDRGSTVEPGAQGLLSPSVPPHKLGLTVVYTEFYMLANSLGPFLFWLLYCFHMCLQFSTLTVMNLYFAQVISKPNPSTLQNYSNTSCPSSSLFISPVFLLVNLACAVLVKTGNWDRKVIASVRVAINDTFFVLRAISLSICLYKISKMSLANIYLESKGSSVCQVTAISVIIILLYISRACYNLFILSFSQIKNVHFFMTGTMYQTMHI
ncbi:Integral membrane protein GPR137B [Heterocephalus glaber]|uniref:Integral membrane protein GPR137B n=1 Tax=Heterocephalus glaber TaxID=10181 RepID=G5AMP5_HETGA|nr:Integral membrane protein GPR137B [Heterocephalus glaber]